MVTVTVRVRVETAVLNDYKVFDTLVVVVVVVVVYVHENKNSVKGMNITEKIL